MTEGLASRPDKVRVVIFGRGSVGSAAAELCARRPWIDVVGVVNRSGEPPTSSAPPEAISAAQVDQALDRLKPEVALIATRPTVTEVLPDIERCAARGIHVICTSEELAFPTVALGESGIDIDQLAKRSGIVVAATGINPGFVFDALALAVAGAAWDIDHIHISRSLDASVFGRDIHRSLGVGYSEPDFRSALESRTIRGHIGFEESANVIARTMGRVVERLDEQVEPVFATRSYELRDYRIETGETAGVTQRATGWVDGKPWLSFDLSLHVAPHDVGATTRDRIRIEGTNAIDVVIEPGTQAVLTTSARVVNTIPAVLDAEPGLYNAAELLPAAPWLSPERPRGRRGAGR